MEMTSMVHFENRDNINDGKFACHAHANMQENTLEHVEQQEVQSFPNTDVAAAAASNLWTPVIIQADPCGAFAADYKVYSMVPY
eukprot:15025547-Ditylum_brightwellii.AAC.1